MGTQIVSRLLPVHLDESDRKARADELVSTLKEIDQLEDERKDVAKKYKERIARSRVRAYKLRQSIETGTEERDVDCEWVPNYQQRLMECVRQDTGEVVEARNMTTEERNLQFPFEGVEFEGGRGGEAA